MSSTASFRLGDIRPIPIPPNTTNDGDLLSRFSEMVSPDTRVKPSYTDCWVLNHSDALQVLTSYRTPYCGVTVGINENGETEYDCNPLEYSYPAELNGIVSEIIEELRENYREEGGRLDRDSVMNCTRPMVVDRMDEIQDICPDSDLDGMVDDICSIVHRYSVGAGIFEILLTDPHIEDIYLDAPCDRNRLYVTLNGIKGVNSHVRCRTNLMVERREVSNLINILKRSSGLRFCQSNPIMETDFQGFDARATVIGYPMSPLGDAVAIRKHSSKPWTLSRLVYNGTIDPKAAGILSFLVDNRSAFLICGPRGAGKSSLLSALMFEFPTEQRILTIEDTIELPGEKMRSMGYKVQSILVDDRMGGNQQSRSDEALRVSLRMGESAIILGEVRGEEARTLYQSMRAGRAGSSIMGTIHGDSAESVFKRVTTDMGVSPDAFMATDIIVTLGTVKDKRNGRLIRRVNEMVCTGDDAGVFHDVSNTDKLMDSELMKRIMRSSQMGRSEIAKEIRARSMMRMVLADAGKTDDGFLGPEWISIANEIVSSNGNLTAEGMCDILRQRMGVEK